jgi:hypothetical protein
MAFGSRLAMLGVLAVQFGIFGPAVAEMRVGDWSVGAGLGRFQPTDDGRLSNRQGEFSLALDVSRRYSENIELGFDFHFMSQEIDTPSHLIPPLLGTLDRRASISTSGFAGTAKWLREGSAGRLYLGAGLGLYRATLRVSGSTLGPVPLARRRMAIPAAESGLW